MKAEVMIASLSAEGEKTYKAVMKIATPVTFFAVEGVLFKGDGATACLEFAYNNPEGGDFYVWCQKHYRIYESIISE